jgi:hypothetical protein
VTLYLGGVRPGTYQTLELAFLYWVSFCLVEPLIKINYLGLQKSLCCVGGPYSRLIWQFQAHSTHNILIFPSVFLLFSKFSLQNLQQFSVQLLKFDILARKSFVYVLQVLDFTI